jgi:hypothetical protein
VAAHPVELIRIEHLLTGDDRAQLSKAATSPNQAERINAVMNLSRFVAWSGVDESSVPAFVTAAIRPIIDVYRVWVESSVGKPAERRRGVPDRFMGRVPDRLPRPFPTLPSGG